MRPPKEVNGDGRPLPECSKLFISDPATIQSDDELPRRGAMAPPGTSPGYYSDKNFPAISPYASPFGLSPAVASPFLKSPWTHLPLILDETDTFSTGLVGSLVREEGHVYSLAASGDLLYTGSESRNIRVWKGREGFAGFKSGSGFVKAIVVAGDRIFTGHQDGKIRVWRTSSRTPSVYRRIGTLPSLGDFLKSSINPSNYVEVRRHRSTVWLRHFDAISCLCLDEDGGVLYSGSWDKTVKVWRVSDSKCLESINAHDDAVNAVARGFDDVLFTGSADGTVKAWRREVAGRGATRHVLVKALLKQESAVTAVAVAEDPATAGNGVVYCGSSDGKVNYWRWEKGRWPTHGGVLQGHRMAVLCMAAAGNVVVSGSADKTLRVWRRDAAGVHARLAVLSGHQGPIKCLAVQEDVDDGPGGRFLVGKRYVVYSGSLDKSVKVWRVLESEKAPGKFLRTPQQVPANAGDEMLRSPLHIRVSGFHV